jgi:pimeloyl-ACP methyl ester carboxylesterase
MAGGPGQSGVDLVLTGYGVKYGPLWKYNFVSFDPRGINHSGPKLLCSPSASNLTNVLGRRQNHDLGDLSETWEARLKENIECSNNNKDTDAKYVGTSAAVQDMMHFVELQAELKGEVPEEAMINYYGVSYGTVIGHTLAAMYPDRIRRLLVDGNVYSAAHYQGWNPVSLDDLAYSIYTFSRLCFEAGTAWCKLAEGMTSPDDVQARFDAVVAKLYENPCTVGGATVDDNAFLNQVHRSLYFPRQGDADGRNYTFLADSILQYENCASGNGSTVAGDFKKRAAAPYVNDVEIGIITAVDIAGRYPWSTYEEWKAATDQFHATHPYGAEGYASSNGYVPHVKRLLRLIQLTQLFCTVLLVLQWTALFPRKASSSLVSSTLTPARLFYSSTQ